MRLCKLDAEVVLSYIEKSNYLVGDTLLGRVLFGKSYRKIIKIH